MVISFIMSTENMKASALLRSIYEYYLFPYYSESDNNSECSYSEVWLSIEMKVYLN